MTTSTSDSGRRSFIRKSAAVTTSMLSFGGLARSAEARSTSSDKELYVIGPMEGYSPQIGTLVSMLNYNRMTVVNVVKSLSMEQLDYLHDPEANTIGGLIMHLGATDKFYQINTFEGRQEYNEEEEKMWGAAMELGEKGRASIKGHDLQFYLEAIAEVREKTVAELRKKDDEWLMAIDPEWSRERPLNTYWKWFHVCEHEANHRGQITWLKSRLPG